MQSEHESSPFSLNTRAIGGILIKDRPKKLPEAEKKELKQKLREVQQVVGKKLMVSKWP